MEEQVTWLRRIDHLNMGTENHRQGNNKNMFGVIKQDLKLGAYTEEPPQNGCQQL